MIKVILALLAVILIFSLIVLGIAAFGDKLFHKNG